MKKITLLIFICTALFLAGCINSKTLRQDYVEDHPELSERDKAAIVNGQVYVGMSYVNVIASWGRPFSVTRRIGPFGVTEIWSYKYLTSRGYWRTYASILVRDGYVYYITQYD